MAENLIVELETAAQILLVRSKLVSLYWALMTPNPLVETKMDLSSKIPFSCF
jgi:hypothetical protein